MVKIKLIIQHVSNAKRRVNILVKLVFEKKIIF